MEDVVITGAARTAMGGFQGVFSEVTAAELGGVAIRAALTQASGPAVDELLMGCVLPAGQGQAPARQAGFSGGLGEDVPATTLNKMCGSGMKATMMAFDRLALGHAEVIVAGGMESMTNAPYILPKMRGGARLGHGQVVDHMFLDGLEDAYDKGRLMGTFAEDCARLQNHLSDRATAALRPNPHHLTRSGGESLCAPHVQALVLAQRLAQKEAKPGYLRFWRCGANL
jgi:acetyl-CoA C-acetyltransferase